MSYVRERTEDSNLEWFKQLSYQEILELIFQTHKNDIHKTGFFSVLLNQINEDEMELLLNMINAHINHHELKKNENEKLETNHSEKNAAAPEKNKKDNKKFSEGIEQNIQKEKQDFKEDDEIQDTLVPENSDLVKVDNLEDEFTELLNEIFIEINYQINEISRSKEVLPEWYILNKVKDYLMKTYEINKAQADYIIEKYKEKNKEN